MLFLSLFCHLEIYLRLSGAANVHWTERHSTGTGKDRQTTTVTYSNHEIYFEYVVPLWQSSEYIGSVSGSLRLRLRNLNWYNG